MANEFIARNGITSLGNIVVSGSITTTGTVAISGSIASASFAATASSADNFLTRGTLTAQTLVVQTITSSVDFVTGSTRFGSLLTNTHVFSGSVTMNPNGLFVSASGLVGIGTTIPSSKLTIESSTYDDFIRLIRTGVGSMGISVTNPRGIQTTNASGSFVGWHVDSSGNVGINTITPGAKLDVKNDDGVSNGLHIIADFNKSSSSSAQILLGYHANGTAVTNASIYSANSQPLRFYTGAEMRMTIEAGGNIGIGTSNPSVKLNTFLNDDLTTIQIRAESNTSDTVSYTGIAPAFLEYYRNITTGVDLTIQTKIQASGSGGNIVFSPNSPSVNLTPVERMRITKNGNVGIGTGIPDSFVASSGFGNLVIGDGSGEKGMTIYSGTTGRGGLMFADATTGSGAYIGYVLYNHSTDTMELATSSVPRVFIKADGRTWIGGAISGFDGSSAILQINGFTRTSGQMIFHNSANVAQAVSVACNGADSFNVAGAFSANSKSFLISHPLANLESTHNLRYVSVEAPQADLHYRGKLTLVNGKGQANIDEASTMTEGTFEALCREVQCFTTNESGWDLVKGKVIGNIIYIESQNTNSTDEISWMVIGERKDKYMMDTSWTDENGKVIVEPLAPIESENTTQEII
jgi:hypothetical protein